MAEEKKEEAPEKEKGYTYEFYHEIGKKGGKKGGETVKKRHGHETLEEVQREHAEGKP